MLNAFGEMKKLVLTVSKSLVLFYIFLCFLLCAVICLICMYCDAYKCSWPWHCTWFPSFK